jgi:hypothetical protein
MISMFNAIEEIPPLKFFTVDHFSGLASDDDASYIPEEEEEDDDDEKGESGSYSSEPDSEDEPITGGSDTEGLDHSADDHENIHIDNNRLSEVYNRFKVTQEARSVIESQLRKAIHSWPEMKQFFVDQPQIFSSTLLAGSVSHNFKFHFTKASRASRLDPSVQFIVTGKTVGQNVDWETLPMPMGENFFPKELISKQLLYSIVDTELTKILLHECKWSYFVGYSDVTPTTIDALFHYLQGGRNMFGG